MGKMENKVVICLNWMFIIQIYIFSTNVKKYTKMQLSYGCLEIGCFSTFMDPTMGCVKVSENK